MLEINSEILLSWVLGLLLPLCRVLGFIAVAPFFSESSVPSTIKLGLGLVTALIIVAAAGKPATVDLLSAQGVLTIL